MPDTVGDGTAVTRTTYASCTDRAEVVLVTIDGAGHTWSGREPPLRVFGKSTRNISANDPMREFCEKHPMQ